jgi:NAD dependent epimerase/dehydratase family enzyme
VNIVSPNPVTNEEFTRTLGHVLNRPTALAMPAFAARLAFGEMADEMLLASQKVLPKKLLSMGFEFKYPQLEAAFRRYVAH